MSHPISTHRKEVCSMSEQFIYQSVFAPYFKDFLAMKENQVSDIGRIKWMLLEFDKFFVNSNIRDVFITKSMIDTWKCTRIHDKKKTLYDKVSMFRQFCLYLCHIGKECYIPKLPKKEHSDFTPYVFTRGQTPCPRFYNSIWNIATRCPCQTWMPRTSSC